MSGRALTVSQRQNWKLNNAASAVTIVPIARLVNTVAAKSGILVVRLYECTFGDTTGEVSIVVNNAAVAPDSPFDVLRNPNTLGRVLLNGGSLPGAHVATLADMAAYVAVTLVFDAGATPTTDVLLDMGVDLVLRTT